MRELLDVKMAVRMVKQDLVKFDITFNKALKNYNEEWFNGTLLESDFEKIRKEFLRN